MFPRPVANRDEGKVYRIASGTGGRVLALMMDTLDGEVRVLDALTLEPRGTLVLGAMRTARAAAVSPDDRAVFAGGHDDVTLFDLGAGTAQWTRPIAGDEPAAAFSPDGASIAVGESPAAVVLLRASDGESTARVVVRDDIRALGWDRTGLIALSRNALSLLDARGVVTHDADVAGPDDEAFELAPLDEKHIAIAGTGTARVWIDIRSRRDGALVRTLTLDGDHRAEGLAMAGGVLFMATEGGTYRADPPFEQLVRWLPPLGGTHDPTRIAAVADSHLALAARDVRLFRTRS